MKYIKVCVTSKVARAVTSGETYQRQITIKDRSPAVTEVTTGANRENKIWLWTGGGTLVVGDSHSIWESHQETSAQKAYFTELFEVLRTTPDQPITLAW